MVEVPRVAEKDDVLPLSKPIVGVSGKVYTELPIAAGTFLAISTVGYNLCVHSLDPYLPTELRLIESSSGTRTCGDLTLMNSGRSGGSKPTNGVKPGSGFTVTCV